MSRDPRAGKLVVPSEKGLSSLALYLGLIPVLLLIVIIPALSLFLQGHPQSRFIFDPPLLRPLLNTIFVMFAACVVSYSAMRSYLLGGSSTVLLLGCGTLALGSGSFVASWLPSYAGLNAFMTVVNLSAMVSSVFHTAGGPGEREGIAPRG